MQYHTSVSSITLPTENMKEQVAIYTLTPPKNQDGDVPVEKIDKEADFETAIAATKFGKFNFFVLLAALPGGWTAVFDTSAFAYVFPAAQCDLNLTLVDKGTLNAVIYVGMICSSILWGYIADTLGRRNVLICGYFLDSLLNILCSFSQTLWMLLLSKFISGFVVCGPVAVLMSYLSEFHAKNIRSRVILLTGTFFSTANIIVPLLAWWIIPQKLNYTLMNFALHSWNLFISLSAIPPFLAGVGHFLLPESPKFLMTMGRNEEAMEIFKKVYSINTGNSKDMYPIKRLVSEIDLRNAQKPNSKVGKITANRGKIQALKEGFYQLSPLFYPPYLKQIMVVFLMYFGMLMSMNTMRLWLPQIFVSMDEYQQLHPHENAGFCEVINSNSSIKQIETKCFVVTPNGQVYINSIIVAISNLCGFILVAYLVEKIRKKVLMFFLLVVGSVGVMLNYWSTRWEMTLAFSATHVALVGICCTTMMSFIVEIFPTSLRTMAVSLSMMCGRVGSIVGNILFPILLQLGCLPPFMFVGGVSFTCAVGLLLLRSKVASTFQ